jgi:hypothetical protein
MKRFFGSTIFAGAAIACASLAGCSTGETGQVKLGVNVSPLTVAADEIPDPRIAAGLEITRVRVLVNVAKVGYAGPSDGSASVGPYVVELTGDELTNGASRSFDLGSLDAGSYGGAEIEVDVLGADADTSDASLADFVSTKASVLIDGTYQGNAFEFAGHFLAEQGTDGAVTIDAAAPFNLPMTVDPQTWFLDDAGAVVDPTDAANHAAIAGAICKSLDTQPQGVAGADGAPGDSTTQHHGGPGGGGAAHCVEAAQ